MVTFGDMAEALDRLRKRDGYLAYHSEREILEEALKTNGGNGLPPTSKDVGIRPTIL